MSSENPLDSRRKAQEEDYFRKQSQKAAENLKTKLGLEGSGIGSKELVEALTNAGFDEDSARALFIVPLVEVALADGRIQSAEANEITKILEQRGIGSETKAFKLVQEWIATEGKAASFLKAKALLEPILKEAKKSGNEEQWIIDACEHVAGATNNLFGLGFSNVSKDERVYIDQLLKKIRSL